MINDSSKKYYFEVSAKCGHVGRTYYYLGKFYVQAPDGKTAASIVRNMPRVMHHHKDAILSVTRIGYEEYQKGRSRLQKDPYFFAITKENKKCQREEKGDLESNLSRLFRYKYILLE